MSDETVRVRYIVGVEVGGSRHAPGAYEAEVTPTEAKALVGAGRALIVTPRAVVAEQHEHRT